MSESQHDASSEVVEAELESAPVAGDSSSDDYSNSDGMEVSEEVDVAGDVL